MPHKRNPILSERICGLARVVRSGLQPMLEDVALWHERDISHSSVERIVLPDSSIAVDYLLFLAERVVGGMRVFPDRMLANLESSGGLVFSQGVLLALVDRGLPRDEAYDLVQRAAAEAWDEGRPFRDSLWTGALKRDLMTREEFDALFDPAPLVRGLEGVFARLEKLEVSAEAPASPDGEG
jgi:adenylosuccinate lyase